MKKFLAFFMPIFGAIYLSAYIRSAMLDVVYTDYIRIINTYLKNPFSPKPYFSKDILTRLPITYFERMINVAFFKYSTYGFGSHIPFAYGNHNRYIYGEQKFES